MLPVAALGLAAAAVVALRQAGLTDTGWIWPATLLYVAAVLAGRLPSAVLVGALHTTASFGSAWTLPGHGTPAPGTLAGVGVEAIWLVAAIATANAYRNRQRWQREVTTRLEQEDRQRDADERRRRGEERLLIAQELHDVVAHTLAVVGVHLNVAADALTTAPEEAHESLQVAQQVRGRAMADLSALVGVLRQDGGDGVTSPPIPPSTDLAQLVTEAVDDVRRAGVHTVLHVRGDPAAVSTPVALAVGRVVREALTNVVRHAGATQVTVTVRYAEGGAELAVVDDGRGGDGRHRPGHGLVGMAERVAALDGRFSAGPGAEGGFAVEATIPGRR